MTNWDRIKEVFAAVADLPIAERPAFLDAACSSDFSLKAEVQKLLESDRHASTFLEEPPPIPAEADPPSAPAASEKRVGPYTLLEKLGEGGMGVVYAADQSSPIRRRVALKLIKRGMDTDEVLRRFEAEKQALSLMDHPNIARVLDAGASNDGRPYFVMEYVSGLPITRYCDEQRLDLASRLQLFMDCCHAIQHAHQKGIIHRDVKPSNALVMIHEGRPIVKVIDFGVAKAVDHRLSERTLYTEQGVLIGTPEYMSPEQAEMSALNVDTRTDVYSLGVLLYELLSGTLPFDPVSLRGSGLAEIQRIIRESEPLVPSARLSRLEPQPETTTGARRQALGKRPGDALSLDEIGWRRRMSPEALRKTLRGDLDWISMRAMEKDRTRRYSTAAGLALDVERYLRGEPVEAGPPSATYRLRKFVHRNRGAVATGALLAISLLGGIAGTTWGLLRAQHNERIARDAASRADTALANEQVARKQAQVDSAQAKYVSMVAGRQAAYASKRLAEMLPAMRRGVDVASSAPPDLLSQYPDTEMVDSTTWLAERFPELLGPKKDAALLAAVSDCGRASVSAARGRQAVTWVLQNEAKINALLEASEKHRFRSSPTFGTGDTPLWQAGLPDIEALRISAALLESAAISRHLKGDIPGTIRCLSAQRRVAISTSYSGTLVSVLCEYAWRQASYQHFRWFVTDHAENGAIPSEFISFLATDRPLPSPGLTTVFDGLSLRQIVSSVFTKVSEDAPPRVSREAVEQMLPPEDELRAVIPQILESDYNATMAALDAYDRLTDLLAQASTGTVDSNDLESVRAQVASQPLLRLWSASLDKSMRSYARLVMERDATIIVLGLAEFRAREGRWPDSLAAALKDATFQPLHRQYLGHPLVYRLVDGRPLLYHPGFDGIDDGAKARARAIVDDAKQTDIVFLSDDRDLRPSAAWLE